VTSYQVGQDYTATLLTLCISGIVTIGGEPFEGVVMSGLPGDPTTDSSGSYSATVDYGWSGIVAPVLAGYTFEPSSREYTDVTSDQVGQDYTAIVIKHTLTINAGNGGTTQPSPGNYAYDYGSQVSIKAIPNSGYKFAGWSGDASGMSIEIVIIMYSDKSITATFSPVPSPDDGDEKKTKCFIATAAYGSPFNPHVKTLRDFRDRYLMSSKLGRVFVDLYYKYSPSVARLISKHKIMKVAVRYFLIPVIVFSYSMINLGSALSLVIIIFAFLFPIFIILYFQKRQTHNYFNY